LRWKKGRKEEKKKEEEDVKEYLES
jgi:hypothetical protein